MSLLPVARMNQAPTCSPLFIIPVSYLLMFVFLYLLPHWIQRISPRCCQDYGYPSQLVPNAKCGPMKCAKARDVHEVTAKGCQLSLAFAVHPYMEVPFVWRHKCAEVQPERGRLTDRHLASMEAEDMQIRRSKSERGAKLSEL